MLLDIYFEFADLQGSSIKIVYPVAKLQFRSQKI
jgi:hypothetical protein